MFKHLRTVLLAALLPLVINAEATAVTTASEANKGTVGIIAGSIDGTSMRVASELSAVLDQGNELRILPIQGKGSVQAINDLLYLRGVDVGIIQRDALEYVRRQGFYPDIDIDQSIRYIAKLFNEEVHIVASTDIQTIADLQGKTVNIGVPGSGTDLTAALLLEQLDLAVNIVQDHHVVALRKLLAGEIEAMIYVGGQPSPLFQMIKPEDGLHLLPIEYTPALIDLYLPAGITADSYPGLMTNGRPVDTIAVEAILAVYNWDEESERYRKVARFVEAFFDRIDELRQEPWHIKWLDLNLATDLNGWQRFSAAQAWLDNFEVADAENDVDSAINEFLAANDLTVIPDSLREQLTEVFSKSAGQSDNGLTFALVPKSVNNAYYSVIHQGCQQADTELQNVSCLYVGPPEPAPQEQAQILQQMVDQRVDGIATAPANSSVIVGVLRRAKEAGIPVVLFDSDLSEEDRDLRQAFIGTDSASMGATMAGEVQRLKPNGGKICMMLSSPDRGSGPLRTQTVRDVLSGAEGTSRLDGQNGWVEPEGCPMYHGGSPQNAAKLLADMLIKEADLDVFLTTDGATQRANADFREVIEPYRQRIAEGKLVMVMPDTLEIQMGQLRDGLTTVQVGQRPFETGYRVINMLHDMTLGRDVPLLTYTDLDVCTKDNIDSCVTVGGPAASTQ